MNNIQSSDSELDKLLQKRYKTLFTRIVLPILLINGFFLFLTHWEVGNERTTFGMLVLLFIVVFNVLLSMKNIPIKTPWGVIETRSDEFDTLRWCINFPLDILLFWSLDMHPAAAPGLWLMLTFGAMVDVYKPRNKLITMGATIISFCVFIIVVYPTDWKTQIYVIASFVGLIYVLWKLERYVFEGMASVFKEQLKRERVEKEAQQLQREAVIGHSTRHLSHELNNLIGIATLSTKKIRDSLENTPNNNIDRLDKAHGYMSKISTLILDDLGNKKAPKRQLHLAILHEDIQLLLGHNLFLNPIEINFNFSSNPKDFHFVERTGSTYLIIHNLIKNAAEAIAEKFGDQSGGVITIGTKVANSQLLISIIDNGSGISPAQLKDINLQIESSSKVIGHGLGLQFVQQECIKNGFKLTIDSVMNEYTQFVISVKKPMPEITYKTNSRYT